MDLNQILEPSNLRSEAVAIAIIVLALILILFVNRRRLLVRFREWRIQRDMKQIGSEQIRDLVCADGLDGHYTIDRLALVDDAILIVAYKPYGGNIYCAERISEWTQVIGQKSFKFENPLFELENQLTALRMITGNVPLRGYLYFNRFAIFPKGHPQSVLTQDGIPARLLADNCAAPTAEIRAAWETLKTHHNEARDGDQVSVKT